MTSFKSTAFMAAFGVLLVSSAGPLRAAPDNTLGMAILAAEVTSSGTLTGGSGAISSSRTGVGRFVIVFQRSLASCFYALTVANHSNFFESGTASATFNNNLSADTLMVATFSPSGAPLDYNFHAIVYCPQ